MALPKKINIITGAIFYLVRKSQILKFKIFKKLFSYFYFFLKQKLECPYYSVDFANRYYYLFQNGNIIDAGAHFGYLSKYFCRALTNNFKVYSFEPTAFNFEFLLDIASDKKYKDKIIAQNTALSAKKGKGILTENYSVPTESKITKILNDKIENIKLSKNQKIVEIISIDDFANTLETKKIKFIKVDTEGEELQILKGAVNTIKNNPDITIALEYKFTFNDNGDFIKDAILEFVNEYFKNIYVLTKKTKLIKIDEISKIRKIKFSAELICTNYELN